MPLARQPLHRRSVHPGPLVLGTAPSKLPTPTADRDRTVSRRSEPSSRAALMGEQPNPWDLLQPQDATSRHRAMIPHSCGRRLYLHPALGRARGQRVIEAIDLSEDKSRLSHDSWRSRSVVTGSNSATKSELTSHGVVRSGVHRYKLALLPVVSNGYTPNVEVPNLPVAVDARGRSACYPRGSFYPLSPDPSTRGPRIT
jgi:hypothetical protein